MIEKINEERYDEVIKTGYSIVDFSATWCGPCQMLAPIMDELSEEYKDKIKFYNIDTDENQNLAVKLDIQSIPTVMLFKDGMLLDTKLGFMPKNMIISWIDSKI